MANSTCVYLDTSVVIAVVDERGPDHDSVVEALGGISGRRLVSG